MARRKSQAKRGNQAQSAVALRHNGKRFFQQGNYNQAIDTWERARQKEPGQIPPAALAEAYFRRGLKNQATQASDLEKAVALQPQDATYRYHLALLYHRQGKLPEAASAYERVQKASSTWQKRVAYPLALAYQQRGQNVQKLPIWSDLSVDEQAMLATARALQRQADLPATDSPLWQGIRAVINGRSPEAIPHLEQANQQPDNEGISHLYLGLIAARDDDWETAVRHWSAARATGFRSSTIEANLGELYHRLAEARWQQQETAAALAAAVEANQFKQDDKQLASLIAHLYQQTGYQAASNGDWETALAKWELAEEEAGNNFRLACNLALAYEQDEDWEMAAELWRKALRHRPRRDDHPDAVSEGEIARLWLRSAYAYHKIEAYEEAVQVFKHAVKWQPDNLDIRLGLVTALLNNGQVQAALNELERILDKDPENVAALIRMGEVLQEGGYYWGAAVPYWERALRLEPDNETARQYMAEHYINQAERWLEWQNNYAHALEQYEKAYSYQPQNGKVLVALGFCHLMLGNRAKGQSYMDEALRLHPTDLEVYKDIIINWLIADEDEMAWTVAEQAEKAVPSLPVSFYILVASNCFVSNNPKQGQLWLERALQRARPDEPVLIMIGEMLAVTSPQYHDIAQHYLNQAIAANQMPGEAYLLLGVLAIRHQDERQAKKHWKAAEKIARKEKNHELLERIKSTQAMFSNPFGYLSRMLGGTGSPLDMLEMMKMLEYMDEDDDEEDFYW
jgi:tetratricopeptide (TPR) repeat protein